MQQDKIIKEEFNIFFFYMFFLVVALKNAIDRNITGLVFYTNDRNVYLTPFGIYKEKVDLQSGLPFPYNVYHNNFKDENKISYDLTAECGNSNISATIECKKGFWHIVLIHFPSDGNEPKMEMTKKINHPGLEDFANLWKEFVGEKTEEGDNGGGNGNGGGKDEHKWKYVGDFSDGLALVQSETGMYGYIDNTGKLVSPCKWKNAYDFNKGLALVKDEAEKYSFIDKTGNVVYNLKMIGDYYEGVALVQDETGKYGYIDNTGKLVSPCKWKNAYDFNKGLALVKDEAEKYSFIDKTGNVVYNLKMIGDYYEEVALVQDETGKYGYIDNTGKLVSPCKWKNAYDFKEGLARVQNESGNWFSINKIGNVVREGEEEAAKKREAFEKEINIIKKKWGNRPFQEGLAAVKGYTGWGFIDTSGELVIPYEWEEVEDFHEDLAAVYNGSEWGFIDKKGNVILPPKWKSVGDFHEGLAGTPEGYIDKTGKLVLTVSWSHADFHDGMARISNKEGKHGFIDKTGKVVIPCTWKYARDFHDGLAMIGKGNKYGFIDKKGKVVIPCSWKCVWDFHEGLARVNKLKFPTLLEWPKYLIFNLSHTTRPPRTLPTLQP